MFDKPIFVTFQKKISQFTYLQFTITFYYLSFFFSVPFYLVGQLNQMKHNFDNDSNSDFNRLKCYKQSNFMKLKKKKVMKTFDRKSKPIS